MNESNTEQLSVDTGMVVSADQPFSMVDVGVLLVVVAVAVYYLYRKLWRNKGTCSSCSNKKGSCGAQASDTGCSSQTIEITELKSDSRSAESGH
ncbi:hypothetical protein [Marinobacterium stanieri]|uniref:hypothetical protein n=1 Tax=Marinobacterium stanieri TaxID=49186 RepID=UPI000255A5AC|nr:hypothetical protein [Marinobacterium stanieri]